MDQTNDLKKVNQELDLFKVEELEERLEMNAVADGDITLGGKITGDNKGNLGAEASVKWRF